MPIEIINGKIAASNATATQPNVLYNQRINVVINCPILNPNGPSTNNASGDTITKHIIGTKKIRIAFGEILLKNFSTKYSTVTINKAGNT